MVYGDFFEDSAPANVRVNFTLDKFVKDKLPIFIEYITNHILIRKQFWLKINVNFPCDSSIIFDEKEPRAASA